MKLTHNKQYVNFGPRLIAGLIDWNLILVWPLMMIFINLVKVESLEALATRLVYLATFAFFPMLIFGMFYSPVSLSRWGYTVGKALVGAKVTNEKGKLLTFKQALFRNWIAKAVSAVLLGLGFWAILFDSKHQAWHDQLTGSLVEKESSNSIRGLIVLIALIAINTYLLYVGIKDSSQLISLFTNS